jgi:hypothetical protein
MDGIEGLYVVNFGVPSYFGSGVIVLETQRFFGGDSMYYWIGDYRTDRGNIVANGTVTLHTPIANIPTIFGDVTGEFRVELTGRIGDRRIDGFMSRPDMPGFVLPVVLTFRQSLP